MFAHRSDVKCIRRMRRVPQQDVAHAPGWDPYVPQYGRHHHQMQIMSDERSTLDDQTPSGYVPNFIQLPSAPGAVIGSIDFDPGNHEQSRHNHKEQQKYDLIHHIVLEQVE